MAIQEILRHGITRTMMSVEFYSSVIEKVQEPEARQLLRKILDQEITSFQQLVAMLELHKSQRASDTLTVK